MGNTFEVYSYLHVEKGVYDYKLIYAGESMMDAMAAIFNEKSKGVGCVKFEWRGTAGIHFMCIEKVNLDFHCEIDDCPQNIAGECVHTETSPEKCYHRKFIKKQRGEEK
jgi:hypothetical protein